MNESPPLPPEQVLQSDAEVFEGTFVEVIEVAVRPCGVNHREHRVDKELNIQRLGFLSWGGHGGYHTPLKNVRGARQAQFRQRLAHGLQTLFSYTRAYAIDDVSSD